MCLYVNVPVMFSERFCNLRLSLLREYRERRRSQKEIHALREDRTRVSPKHSGEASVSRGTAPNMDRAAAFHSSEQTFMWIQFVSTALVTSADTETLLKAVNELINDS